MSVRYYTFPTRCAAKVAEQLAEAGEGAVLRFIPARGGDGPWVQVVAADEPTLAADADPLTATSRFAPLNHAHPCPPDC